jgi:hypothetical protein
MSKPKKKKKKNKPGDTKKSTGRDEKLKAKLHWFEHKFQWKNSGLLLHLFKALVPSPIE